jgi:hypothetical protein
MHSQFPIKSQYMELEKVMEEKSPKEHVNTKRGS